MALIDHAAELSQLLDDAGCTPATKTYLAKQGYTNLHLLSKAGASDDAVTKRLIKPFIDGWEDDAGVTHTATNPNIAEASILIAVENARTVRAASLAPLPALAGSIVPAFGPPAPSPSAHAVPKFFEPGVFQALLDDWETATVPRRTFPKQLLAGAESTLARLHHELTVSRLYTPLPLAEVIKLRAYNTDGSVNMKGVQSSHRDALLRIEGGSLKVQPVDSSMEYLDGGRWTLWDAVEANSYALKLTKYGSDASIDGLAILLQRLVRDFTVTTSAFNYVYTAIAYRITFAMRGGVTFDAEAGRIVDEKKWIEEQRAFAVNGKAPKTARPEAAGPAADDRGQPKKTDRPARGKANRDTRNRSPPARGSGNGNRDSGGGGKSNRDRDAKKTPSGRNGPSRSRSQRTIICRSFQNGICNRVGHGEKPKNGQQVCRFSHECWKCGKKCGRGGDNCKGR